MKKTTRKLPDEICVPHLHSDARKMAHPEVSASVIFTSWSAVKKCVVKISFVVQI